MTFPDSNVGHGCALGSAALDGDDTVWGESG